MRVGNLQSHHMTVDGCLKLALNLIASLITPGTLQELRVPLDDVVTVLISFNQPESAPMNSQFTTPVRNIPADYQNLLLCRRTVSAQSY